MAGHLVIGVLLGLLAATSASAAPHGKPARPALLVADVELVELAPPDQRYDQAQDAVRVALLSRHIRAAVMASGRYRVLDRGMADRVPPYRYMNCKACIFDWAHQRTAGLVLADWVQKESRLIPMVNMALIDAAYPAQEAAGGSVDLRGDTDAT
ncbi:MAG: DUF2380 domain-containing protein [Rhodanobacter sp.]|nr:MAG: DUF2380 domain-containing protein [Rhodanobacter sp.]